jgi:transcriptional regulator with XRE-family HTH domain
MAAGLNGAELARNLGWSAAQLSRYESANRNITTINVAALLGYCQATDPERAEILALTNPVEDGCWVRPHDGLLPEAVPSVLYQFQTATDITCYDPGGIPPLLQSADYIDADLLYRFGPDTDVSCYRHVRQIYRALLGTRNRPGVVCYLHESALRALPLDEDTCRSQFLAMVLATGAGAAVVRIIPAGDESTLSIGGFSLLRIYDYPSVVIHPAQSATLILEGPEHIRTYANVAATLNKLALSELDSRDLLANLAEGRDRATTRRRTATAHGTRRASTKPT